MADPKKKKKGFDDEHKAAIKAKALELATAEGLDAPTGVHAQAAVKELYSPDELRNIFDPDYAERSKAAANAAPAASVGGVTKSEGISVDNKELMNKLDKKEIAYRAERSRQLMKADDTLDKQQAEAIAQAEFDKNVRQPTALGYGDLTERDKEGSGISYSPLRLLPDIDKPIGEQQRLEPGKVNYARLVDATYTQLKKKNPDTKMTRKEVAVQIAAMGEHLFEPRFEKYKKEGMEPEAAYDKAMDEAYAVVESASNKLGDKENYITSERKGSGDPWIKAFSAQFTQGAGVPDFNAEEMAYMKAISGHAIDQDIEKRLAKGETNTIVKLKDGTEMPLEIYKIQVTQSPEIGDFVSKREVKKTRADVVREMGDSAKIPWFMDPETKIDIIANPEEHLKTGWRSGSVFKAPDPYGSYRENKAGQALRYAQTVPNVAAGTAAYGAYDFTMSDERRERRKKAGYQPEDGLASFDYVSGILQNIAENRGVMGEEREASDIGNVETFSFSDDPDSVFYSAADETGKTPLGWVADWTSAAGGFGGDLLIPDFDVLSAGAKGAKVARQTTKMQKELYGSVVDKGGVIGAAGRAGFGDLVANNAMVGLLGGSFEAGSARSALTRGLTDNYAASITVSRANNIDEAVDALKQVRLDGTAYGQTIVKAQKNGDTLEDAKKALEGFYSDAKTPDDLADLGKFLDEQTASAPRQKDVTRAVLAMTEADDSVKAFLKNVDLVADEPKAVQWAKALMADEVYQKGFLRALAYNKAATEVVRVTKGIAGLDNVVQVTPNLWAGKGAARRITEQVGNTELGQLSKALAADENSVTLKAVRERAVSDPNIGTEVVYTATPVRVKEAYKLTPEQVSVIDDELVGLVELGKLPRELDSLMKQRLDNGFVTVEDLRSIINAKLDMTGEGLAASGAIKGDVTRARDVARLSAGEQLDLLEPLESRSFLTTTTRKIRENLDNSDSIGSTMSVGQKQLLGEAQTRAAALDNTLRRDLKRAMSDLEFRALYGIPEDATRHEVLSHLVVGPLDELGSPVGESGLKLDFVGDKERVSELLMDSLNDNFTSVQTKENIFDLLTGTRVTKNTGVFSKAGHEVLKPLLDAAAERVLQNRGSLFEEVHGLINRVDELIEGGAKRGGGVEDFVATGKGRKAPDAAAVREDVEKVRANAQAKIDDLRASVKADQDIIRATEKDTQKMTTAEKTAENKRIAYDAYTQSQDLKKAELKARNEIKESVKEEISMLDDIIKENKKRTNASQISEFDRATREKQRIQDVAKSEAAELRQKLTEDLEQVKADRDALQDILKNDTEAKRLELRNKKNEDIARKQAEMQELIEETKTTAKSDIEGIKQSNVDELNEELARRWSNDSVLRYPPEDIRNFMKKDGGKLSAPAMIGSYYRAEASRIVDELLSDLTSKDLGKGNLSVESYFDTGFNNKLETAVMTLRDKFRQPVRQADGSIAYGEAPGLGGPKTQLLDLVTIQLKKKLKGKPSAITDDDIIGMFADTETAKMMREDPELFEKVVQETGLRKLLAYAGEAADDISSGIIRRNKLGNNDLDIDKIDELMEELKWNPTYSEGTPKELHRKRLQLLFGDDVTEQLVGEFLQGFKELRSELIALQAKAYESGSQKALRHTKDVGGAIQDAVYFWLLNGRSRFHGANILTGADIVYSTTGRLVNPADLAEGLVVQTGYNPNKIQLTDNAGRSYTRRELRDILQDRTGRSIYSMNVTGADSSRNINLLAEQKGMSKAADGFFSPKKIKEQPLSPQTKEAYAIFKDLPQAEDLMFRYAILKRALAEGRSMEDAVALAKRSMFDSGNLTNVEKKLKGAALFYGFQRNNLLNAFKNILTLRGQKRLSRASRIRDRVSEALVGEEAEEYAPSYAKTRMLLKSYGFDEKGKGLLAMGPSMPSLDGFYGLTELIKGQPQGVVGGAVRPELKKLVGIEDKFDREFKEVPPEHVAYLRTYMETHNAMGGDITPADIINEFIMPGDSPVVMVPKKGPNGETYMSIPLNTPAQRAAYKKFFDKMTVIGLSTATMDYGRIAGAKGTKYEDLGLGGKAAAGIGALTVTTQMSPERQAYYDLLSRSRMAQALVRDVKEDNLSQFKEDNPASEGEKIKIKRTQAKDERAKAKGALRGGQTRRQRQEAYDARMSELDRLRRAGEITPRQHRALRHQAKRDYR